MSRHAAKAAVKAAARAAILRLLCARHPDPMTFLALQEALMIERYPMEDRDLAFQLDYLAQGDYIKLECARKRFGPAKIQLVSIARKGIDLLDGRRESDPGIAL
jgi:hypothetical protein